MTFKARVLMYSTDGKEWTVDVREYVTTDINPETGKVFQFGKFYVQGVLREGDVLIMRPRKNRRC